MCFSAASLGAKGFDYFEKERKNRDWSGIKATEQQKTETLPIESIQGAKKYA